MFCFPQSASRKSVANSFAAATLALVSFTLAAQAQTPEWAWIAGSSGTNAQGTYGTKGIASPANTPGSRYLPARWTDSSGNFWMFSGQSVNDLWKFNPLMREWTWVSGNTQGRLPGNYGMLGKTAATNLPGGRVGAVTWVDAQGRFWLFGGAGYDSTGASGVLNDLWMLDPSTLEWTWIGGSSTIGSGVGQPGVYGQQRTPDVGNIPGGRTEGSAWTDSNGNFWLFGGNGVDANGNFGYLNDVWEYNPSAGEWTWVTGSSALTCVGTSPNNVCSSAASYGMMGTPTLNNTPGGRYWSGAWTDASGNFWLFGGAAVQPTQLNDLWEFSPATTEWTWMGGSDSGDVVDNTSTFPGSRMEPTSWTDSNGNLWLFGGWIIHAVEVPNYGPYVVGDALNDLWEFSPANQTWTYWGGGGTVSCTAPPTIYIPPSCTFSYGNYATPGEPRARFGGIGWTDSNNNLWLFGGDGADGQLNDLWEYAPAGATAMPAFNPPAGSYNGAQPVTITSTTANATIYYTLDGTTPTTVSPQYSGAITLNQITQTLKAMAFASGFGPSPVASATYNLTLPQAAKPVFAAAAGTYKSPQKVTISSSTPNARIYYAINSTPTAASTLYNGPITITQSEVIEAIAVAPGYSNSAEVSADYVINASTVTLAVASSFPAYNLSCSVSAPGEAGKAGPTGTVTFTDTATGKTLGTVPLGVPKSSSSYQLLPSAVGQGPVAIVAADFNGDGKTDLAIANGNGSSTVFTVSILLGNGDGTFQPQIVSPVGSYPLGIAVGDFNHDGKPDLVIVSDGDDEFDILLGNGDGTFKAAKSVPIGDARSKSIGSLSDIATNPSGSSAFVVGDFNQDGKLDLFLQSGLHFKVFLGNGDGTFKAPIVTPAPGYDLAFVAGDFNNDGKLDLVVSGSQNEAVPLTLMLGNGDGTFQSQPITAGTPFDFVPVQIGAADFNGDGNLDLVAVNHYYGGQSAGTLGIVVLLGNGDGTFQYSPVLRQHFLSSPYVFSGITFGRFYGDSNLDIALADSQGSDVMVLVGAGDGTFTGPAMYSSCSRPSAIVAANFTANGITEFATANSADNDITVELPRLSEQATASLSNVVIDADGFAAHGLQMHLLRRR